MAGSFFYHRRYLLRGVSKRGGLPFHHPEQKSYRENGTVLLMKLLFVDDHTQTHGSLPSLFFNGPVIYRNATFRAGEEP